jgi:hypothetical protein
VAGLSGDTPLLRTVTPPMADHFIRAVNNKDILSIVPISTRNGKAPQLQHPDLWPVPKPPSHFTPIPAPESINSIRKPSSHFLTPPTVSRWTQSALHHAPCGPPPSRAITVGLVCLSPLSSLLEFVTNEGPRRLHPCSSGSGFDGSEIAFSGRCGTNLGVFTRTMPVPLSMM